MVKATGADELKGQAETTVSVQQQQKRLALSTTAQWAGVGKTDTDCSELHHSYSSEFFSHDTILMSDR